jgi:hypothetical protein
MTRFLSLQLGTSHSYSIGALERDLGYRERVTTAEASARLVELVRAMGRESSQARAAHPAG